MNFCRNKVQFSDLNLHNLLTFSKITTKNIRSPCKKLCAFLIEYFLFLNPIIFINKHSLDHNSFYFQASDVLYTVFRLAAITSLFSSRNLVYAWSWAEAEGYRTDFIVNLPVIIKCICAKVFSVGEKSRVLILGYLECHFSHSPYACMILNYIWLGTLSI